MDWIRSTKSRMMQENLIGSTINVDMNMNMNTNLKMEKQVHDKKTGYGDRVSLCEKQSFILRSDSK